MGGLKNRFNRDRLRSAWAFHYLCLWCGEAGFDCFHHIISPGSSNYKEGSFNSSILNALPMHNHKCHLYQPGLHSPENEKKLLWKVLETLTQNKFKFNEKDEEFFMQYRESYGYLSVINKGLTTR